VIKEYISTREKESKVKIQNTTAAAVRKKNIVKKGVRVYENGNIGVAGSVGDITYEELEVEAVKNLEMNIQYDSEISKNTVKHVEIKENTITHEDVLEESKYILNFLKEEFGDFDFSEGIAVKETTVEYKNTEGVDLSYNDTHFFLEMIMKLKTSTALFDGLVLYEGRNYNREKFIDFNREYIVAHRNVVDLPEGERLPVFFLTNDKIFNKLISELNGDRYGNGSSSLSGKLNERVFNKTLNIDQYAGSANNYAPIFDSEGIVNENYHYPLVEEGVLKACFTNKKVATEYNIPHTGAATAEYDGIPLLSDTKINFKRDSYNLKEATNGKAIFVIAAFGGDFTDEGAYASPVQLSFLYDGEKIVGKLPMFMMKSHFSNMFNEDYLGTFKNPMYFGDDDNVVGIMMDIVRR